MFLDQFKELSHLITFRILSFRLDGQRAREFWMDILAMAAGGSNVFKAERAKQPLEITE